MIFSTVKKYQYWNHWIAYIFVDSRTGKPNGVTGSRLAKVKDAIWQDTAFWEDILSRHLGSSMTPEEMAERDPKMYDHMIGNFTSMVYQTMIETGLIPIR